MANFNGNGTSETYTGTALADVINGNGGNDTLDGGDGNDTMNGGSGNDVVDGGLGDDIVRGGNGHDVVRGGDGADRLYGDAGNDNLVGGAGDDLIDGGSGTDWADFAGGAAVFVDLTAGIATGQGTDTLVNIERVNGTSFNDVIRGNAAANILQGGDGDDLFLLSGGYDTIHGGAGFDTLDLSAATNGLNINLSSAPNNLGGYGGGISGGFTGIEAIIGTAFSDSIGGDAGDNFINAGLGAQDIIDGGDGVDTLSFAGLQSHNTIALAPVGNPYAGSAQHQWNGVNIGVDQIAGIENVIGGDHIDVIRGNEQNNTLNGAGGVDTLHASLGVDVLDGGDGAFDIAVFDAVGAVTADLGAGAYTINANNHGTLLRMEHLKGGAAGDVLTGDAGVNQLMGAGGADVLAGGQGDDELWGGAGADRLVADGGADLLVGDYDRIDGYGDDASDVFVITAAATNVTISDFKIGTDKLDLTAFGFDQNGVSPYWTGSAVQSGPAQVLTLTGLANETVTVTIEGLALGEELAMTDMIGGSPSLIAQAVYPGNGGNGMADVFVLVDGGFVTQNGLITTLNGFENGLDQLDVTWFWNGLSANNQPYDIQLHSNAQGDVVFHMDDFAGSTFDVTIVGFTVGQLDETDFIW